MLIDSLPLKEGMRILEIGCGPGAAAREITHRFKHVCILAIDRSEKAINQAASTSQKEISAGKLKFQQAAVEEFNLPEGEKKFDLAFAFRVGALDGRHPEIEKQAKQKVKSALKPSGKLYIDRGDKATQVEW